MATFIKAKLKKSYGQTNIDKYRVAAHGHKILQNILPEQQFDFVQKYS